jgi:hypothetical protein
MIAFRGQPELTAIGCCVCQLMSSCRRFGLRRRLNCCIPLAVNAITQRFVRNLFKIVTVNRSIVGHMSDVGMRLAFHGYFCSVHE